MIGLAARGAAGTLLVAAVGTTGLRIARSGMDALATSKHAQRLQMDADMMHDAIRADILAALLGVVSHDAARIKDGKDALAEHRTRFRKSIAETREIAAPSTQAIIDSLKSPVDAYLAEATRWCRPSRRATRPPSTSVTRCSRSTSRCSRDA